MLSRTLRFFAAATMGSCLLLPAFAQNEIIGMPKNEAERQRALEDKGTRMPAEMRGVGVDEHLGETIDLNLMFVGEDGYPHPLKDVFAAGRPVILNLVYYKCPMLCNLTLNGQVNVLRELAWTPGKEFEIVTISIDPTETFQMAKEKKAAYLSNFDRPIGGGWHFYVDYRGNVKRLAEQIGFHYNYDAHQQQYAHSSAVMVLTPQGKISRYLYGIKFKDRDVRLALTEAAEGKFGLSFEKLLMMCYHYDASAKSYVLYATNVMRLGGLLVVVALATFLFRNWRNDLSAQEAQRLKQHSTGAGQIIG